jgi:signal transduction histidine kinase
MLAEVGEIFHESRDSDTIIQAILVGITAGKGLGFNRAFYLQVDPEGGHLRGRLAIGPTSSEEAWETWNELNQRPLSLYELVKAYQEKAKEEEFPIDRLVRELVVPLDEAKEFVDDTVHARSALCLTKQDALGRVPLDLIERLGSDSFAVVPLRLDRDVQGVIIVDNAFTRNSITDDDLRGLELFANQAMLAIERARLYSELEQHIQEIREANVRLKQEQELRVHSEKLKAVGKMATHVAHEIRNPMTAIGGFARTILRSLGDDDPNRAFAQIITDETSRLERILIEVLEYSRERPVVVPRPTDCKDLLRHIVNVMQDEIRSRKATPHIHLPDGNVTIMADSDQISQVLHNLIQNALDALGDPQDTVVETEPRRTISISLEIMNSMAIVGIEDTGTGLDDEAVKRLFEPFFTTKAKGTGLGLAISRQIVADHGGEITVTNNEYGGATFRVALPLHEEDCNGPDTRS